jgi:hypothetical protein
LGTPCLREEQAHCRQRDSREHGGVLQTRSERSEHGKKRKPQRAGDGLDPLVQVVDGTIPVQQIADDAQVDEAVVVHPSPLETGDEDDDRRCKGDEDQQPARE